MVFFTCNACNESLKKNQVEKHYKVICKRCEFLSCVDCGKEFWGDTYQTHIKCMTEDEKYSGKNYVAKVNKGEVKQEQWIQKVQAAIQKASANPQLKNLLQKLKEFPNVPRKKAKFENFVKCSLRVHNHGLVSQVWDVLMSEAQQQHKHQNGDNSHTNGEVNEKTDGENGQGVPTNNQIQEPEADKKLSKRERKEERRKKTHKEEKKDKQVDENVNDDGKKKQKKRKNRDESDDEENNHPSKKKRKGDITTEIEETTEETERDPEQDSAVEPEKRKGRFDWGAIIVAVLQAKGEISIKKLQKKVLSEYAAYGGSKGEERAEAKFTKKLKRVPNVRVLKDRAKLISS